MKDTVRTFVAVETSSAVRQRAAELIEILAATGAKVSWAKHHNLHLTLKFLDEVRWNEIGGVTQAVREAAQSAEPFDLEIRGAGAFPSAGKPRTLWLGTADGSEPLAAAPCRTGKSTETARLSQRASPLCRPSYAGTRPRRRAGRT